MKRVIKIAMLSIGWVFACWMLSACSSVMEEPDNGISDGSTATLTIQAAVPGTTTRADATIPEREQIEKLRIIVVDKATNKVEYNSLLNFPNRDGSSYNIEVTKNSTKDVYFLANAEDWCLDFPEVGEIYNPDEDESEGDEGDDDIIVAKTTTMPSLFNQEIENLPENLPYTSKYEIEVADSDVEATCYIAIAAVKFDIVFNNNTDKEIEVKSLEIGGIANQSYLFPHNEKWDEWVTNITGNNTNKDYFTDYDIPENTVHGNYLVPGDDGTQGNAGDGSENPSFTVSAKNDSEPGSGSYTIPTFYCHESKNETESNKQQYFIQFEIDDKVFISEIKTEDTSLESLIRSTHVRITVNINSLEQTDADIIISGEIVDWNWLDEVTGDIEEVEEQSES